MVFSRCVISRIASDIDPEVRTLRRGKHRLFLWAGREADGSDDSATPSKLGVRDEMGRLEKVCKHTRIVADVLTVPDSLSRSTSEGTYPSLIGWTI